MNGKVIAGVVSIILVVGVVIGVIAGVSTIGNDGKNNTEISSTSRAVAAICSPTDYKQQCVQSLSSTAHNESATPKDFIQAAISYTVKQVELAMNNSGDLVKLAKNDRQKMAVEDCKDLLQSAIDELQASFSVIGDAQLHTLKDREAELQNWLSAVVSYQQSCLDGMEQPDLKTNMSNGLLNSTQLTSNALAIVTSISDIIRSFNIPTNSNSNSGSSPSSSPISSSRRLLETTDKGEIQTDHKGQQEEGMGGFPSWFTGADRKLLQAQNSAKPNAIVAKDGSGQFKTIGEALASYPPKGQQGRFVIYVKAGVYDEYVTVTKKQTDVFMYGDGAEKTIVTGNKSYASNVSTFKTAPFSVVGWGFICKEMGFRNTAGPEGHQAVALRVQSDRAAFYKCRMEGFQHTLHTQAHRQFYSKCVISGTIDFIFGDAAVVIQNSVLMVRKPMKKQQNIVTAQGRSDKRESTGLIIQNCRIVGDEQLNPTRLETRSYLGRAWKAYSRTVIMESSIGDLIQPEGWLPWDRELYLDTLFYAEYANRGAGAVTAKRVKWKGYKVITDRKEVEQYSAQAFIQGNEWLRATGAPFFLGFTNSNDFL